MLCLFFYVGPSHLRRILFHLLEWTKIHQAIFKTVRISSVLFSFLSIWPLNSISHLLFDLPQSIAYMLHGENYENINLKRMHGSFALASSVWNSFENCTRGTHETRAKIPKHVSYLCLKILNLLILWFRLTFRWAKGKKISGIWFHSMFI